ncbi:hypothetical protein AB0O32_38155 [Streptomyces rubiginosohelvolus]|uniref:hypothetical protein n=1 Tax=Streptomyces rubiginosohelvolus TaxID=67362 RepID=UPI0034262256
MRDGCLHDARHTAATVLLILGISDAVVDSIMGWEPGKSARMRRRYQHMTGPVLQQTAAKIGALLWAAPADVALEAGSDSAVSPGSALVDSAVYLADLGGRRLAFASREHAEQVVTQWGEDRPGQAAQVEHMEREQWEDEVGDGIRSIRQEIPDRRLVHHAHAVFLAGGKRLNVGGPAQWSTWAWEFEPDVYTDLPVRWHTSRRPGQEVEAQVRGADKDAVSSAYVEACAQAVDRAQPRHVWRRAEVGVLVPLIGTEHGASTRWVGAPFVIPSRGTRAPLGM